MDDLLQRKAKWLSRRGLLELDIFLSRFLNSTFYANLEPEELLLYLQLLEKQDPELLALLQNKAPSKHGKVAASINKIKMSVKKEGASVC